MTDRIMNPEDFETMWASEGDLYLVCPEGPHPGEEAAAGWIALPVGQVSLGAQLRRAREHIVAAHRGAWCQYCRQLIQRFPGLNGWRVTVDDPGRWCPQSGSAGFHYPG